MPIQIGERLPSVVLKRIGTSGVEDVPTGEFFAGRRVVLFCVPGAFTPTCHKEHLPGYIARADEIRSKGVNEIVCLAVNDPFVMKAWGEALGAPGKVTLLSDWNAEFVRALGLDQSIVPSGLGVRGRRFSMLVNDGVVETLDVEPARGVSVSGAEACLLNLD